MSGKEEFFQLVQEGRLGNNIGLSIGSSKLEIYMDGFLPGTSYLIGGASGTGKSTYMLWSMVYQPLIHYLNSIVIRGYTGNVGTTCGQIMEDDDVDLMFGWSSIDNVTSTGGMDPKSLLETITEYKVGEKNRTIHRLSDKETAITVLDWMKSDACRNLFA